MRKIYSLLLLGAFMLLGAQSAWAGSATSTTVYLAYNNSTSFKVKVEVKCDSYDDNSWQRIEMTPTGRTYTYESTSYTVYSATFTDQWGGSAIMHFSLYNGNTRDSYIKQDVHTDWKDVSTYNYRMYSIPEDTWKDVFTIYDEVNSTHTIIMDNTATFALGANTTFEFKVTKNRSTWYGINKDANNKMYCNNCSNWLFTTDGDNKRCILYTTVAGNYTLNFDGSNARMTATYPSTYTRSGLTAGGWGTLCLPVKINSITGATLYQVHSFNSDGSGIILFEPSDYYAGNAYIFKLNTGVTSISVGLDNASYSGTANSFQGLCGTFAATTINGSGSETNLYVVSGGELIQAAKDCSVGEFRAYVNRTSVPAYEAPTAPGVRYLDMPMAPENATDIKSIEANEKAIKFIKNGQIFIQKNGVVYDVTGRAVR